MRSQELSRQEQKLRSLQGRALVAAGGDAEMLSHWAKYLCVLVAGFLENAVAQVYIEFVQRAASEPVKNYAISRLRTIQNPKTGRFLEISASFKSAWRDELEAFVDRDGRREAIDSIMHNRHLIAHGKDSDITMVRVKDYMNRAIQVVELMEEQCQR